MGSEKLIYQHVVPQEDMHHKVEAVDWSNKKNGRICKTCGERVAQFPANEGPESLKSLLRIR